MLGIGDPTPPEKPVPSPVGPDQRIPSLRSVDPHPNLLEGFARYLKYRKILYDRKRRQPKAPAGSPKPSDQDQPETPGHLDKRA